MGNKLLFKQDTLEEDNLSGYQKHVIQTKSLAEWKKVNTLDLPAIWLGFKALKHIKICSR